MEIQKIFSNIENPSENLYSVLVSEEELALLKEFSDKMSDEEYESKVKKILKDGSKAAVGTGAGLVGAVGATKLAYDAAGDLGDAKLKAKMAKASRVSKSVNTKEARHALAKFDIDSARKLVKRAKRKGAGAAAGYAASLAGLAYAGKKLHDISKQEKDPRFAKKLEEVTAKGKKS